MIVIPLVVVLGYWFLLLTPQRKAAAEAAKTLAAEQARLAEAQSRASTVQAAKASFADDYAAVVALGKAIPTSVDMPSLLVQLEQAAARHRHRVRRRDGRRARTRGRLPPRLLRPRPPAAGRHGPERRGAAERPGRGGRHRRRAPTRRPRRLRPASRASATAPTDPAAAGRGRRCAGRARLEPVSLEFTFNGDFFELADFFHRLKRFVFVDGDKVRVRGRLMTIDSVEYATDADTFPALTATVERDRLPDAEGGGRHRRRHPGRPPGRGRPPPHPSTASTDSTSPTPAATATP